MNLSFIQDKDVCGILILADREADNDNRWMMVLISADLSACHMGGVQAFRPYSKEMVVCVGWGGEERDGIMSQRVCTPPPPSRWSLPRL